MPRLSQKTMYKSSVRAYVASQTMSYFGEKRGRSMVLTHRRRVCTVMDLWYNKAFVHDNHDCGDGWALYKGELVRAACQERSIVHARVHESTKLRAWMCNEGANVV